ncbi:MAG: hypothetical protein JOS17DRAFT_804298 [Linnemannia elongata]|nr:MAG: hypothetical protein JOS17DRAFT_804298 [Linnemannia elongata]
MIFRRESDFERLLLSPMLGMPGATLTVLGTGATTTAAAGGERGDHTNHARELETAFCRDFYCCGLTLLDLHDLLQHYEECHVRFEEDEDCRLSVNGSDDEDSEFFDEDSWSDSESLSSSSGSSSSPLGSGSGGSLSINSRTTGQHHRHHRHQPYFQQYPNGSVISTKIFSASLGGVPKRKAVVSLSDIYAEDEGGYEHDDGDPSSAFLNTILRTRATSSNIGFATSNPFGPPAKRQLLEPAKQQQQQQCSQQNPQQHERLHPITGEPIRSVDKSENSIAYGASNSNSYGNSDKSIRVHSSGFAGGSMAGTAGAYGRGNAQGSLSSICPNMLLGGSVPTTSSVRGLSLLNQSPYIAAAADLMRQRDEVFSIIEDMTKVPPNASSENKPYRCSVTGCDKAYKNPNGLKYHNSHGHCSNGLGDGDSPESKPYVCTFLECGKRYKNLNGLKYHIEHTHPNLIAALRAHQSGLANHPLIVNGLFENGSAAAMTIAAALAAVEASPMMALVTNAILTAQAAAANQANAAAAAAATAAATTTSESAASTSGQSSHGGAKVVSDSEQTASLEGGFASTAGPGLPQVVMAISGSLESASVGKSGSHHSMVPIAPRTTE